MGAGLEAIVKHHGRLDILCCLVDGDALAPVQLSAQTGMGHAEVEYCLTLLDLYGLVGKADGLDGEIPLYVATLDRHPAWVKAAVREHRGA